MWAWSEKDTFHNLSRIANIALDPAFILICIGKPVCFCISESLESGFRNCNICDRIYGLCWSIKGKHMSVSYCELKNENLGV